MTVSRTGLRLSVAGELDLSTGDRLAGALRRLDRAVPSVVDLTGVTFADSTGLKPLVEAVRRHETTSPLAVAGLSGPVRRVFDLLDVACEPVIDVAAWDAAGST
jgi:anti-anti-sigma factor